MNFQRGRGHDEPEINLIPLIDVLLVKIPRSVALLEDELRRVAPLLHDESIVVGAGMTKRVHTSTIELFQNIIGPTVTSRSVKKARLILTKPDPALDAGPSPWPATPRSPTSPSSPTACA